MKYIMFALDDRRLPVIFPDDLNHIDVAEALTAKLNMSRMRPVSAGSVDGLAVLAASGKSETLQMNSAPDDATVINVYPYCAGLDTGRETEWETMVLLAQAKALTERLEKLTL